MTVTNIKIVLTFLVEPARCGHRRSNRQSAAKPQAAIDSTDKMGGGVNLADQKHSYYEIRITSKKWPTHILLGVWGDRRGRYERAHAHDEGVELTATGATGPSAAARSGTASSGSSA